MNSIYELKLDEFAGPLDKLLELIETKKLEITKINLAAVTADFLGYLKNLDSPSSKVLADFIAVASKLILIKSHTLLPSLELSEEEKTDIAEFEARLRLYKEFKQAEKNIRKMWAKKTSYGRDFFIQLQGGFYLSQPVFSEELRDIVVRLCEEATLMFPKLEEHEVKLINFEEKMRELLERVSRAASASFGEITKGRGRAEVVVLFLAILHLLKDSLLKVEQQREFEDIKITKS